jgi:glycolate oxidase FAD binding subunit
MRAALHDANESGDAVIPWGGGHHMMLGNVPSRYDVALRTARLNQVIEYEPADLTITVEAGITMSELQRLLAEHGQFLPIDAPSDATVGGVLAAGLSGPSAHAYGLPRDWLIGCRIALADGTLIKGGGRVVKNVAGYDMTRLAVGSLGTLGVIAEATFKLAPLPAAQEVVIASCRSLEHAIGIVLRVDECRLALGAAAVANDPMGRRHGLGGPLAALWIAGPQSAVQRSTRELRDIAAAAATNHLEGGASETLWATLIESQPNDGATRARASIPPSAVTAFLERCDGPAVAYVMTGAVDIELRASDAEGAAKQVDALRCAARDAGGSLVVTQAPSEAKQHLDVWGESDALPLMRRLKDEFDPGRTLNPGRFIGGI